MVDALSRWATLLATLQVEMIGFDQLQDCYTDDANFGDIRALTIVINRTNMLKISLLVLVLYGGGHQAMYTKEFLSGPAYSGDSFKRVE